MAGQQMRSPLAIAASSGDHRASWTQDDPASGRVPTLARVGRNGQTPRGALVPPTRRYLKLLLRKVTPAGAEPIELWKPAVPDPVEVMLAKVIAVPPSNRTA